MSHHWGSHRGGSSNLTRGAAWPSPTQLIPLPLPAGTAEAVQLLAVSADGDWLAATSSDWAINIYSLQQFKVRGCRWPGERTLP